MVDVGLICRVARANLLDGEGMGSLLVPDLAQQPVGVWISGRAPVEVPHLVVLRGLAGGQQPLHGGDPGLKPQP
jgi:hypothetical protein